MSFGRGFIDILPVGGPVETRQRQTDAFLFGTQIGSTRLNHVRSVQCSAAPVDYINTNRASRNDEFSAPRWRAKKLSKQASEFGLSNSTHPFAQGAPLL